MAYPGFWFGGNTFGGRLIGGPRGGAPWGQRNFEIFKEILKKIAKNALF